MKTSEANEIGVGQPSAESRVGVLSVVMPAYNEENSIRACLKKVLAQEVVGEVIVVNDGSKDRTSDEVNAVAQRDSRVRLLEQPFNQGKGAALRTGFQHCSKEFVIVQDADLEYTPSDYPRVMKPLLDGDADVVFGSRFLGGGSRRVLYFWHCVGNQFLTLLSNCFTGLNLSDMETGTKVFRRSVLEQMELQEGQFGIEPEMVAQVAALKVRIYEVPISYFGRTYEEGKKIGWRDGVWAIWCILKYGLWQRGQKRTAK